MIVQNVYILALESLLSIAIFDAIRLCEGTIHHEGMGSKGFDMSCNFGWFNQIVSYNAGCVILLALSLTCPLSWRRAVPPKVVLQFISCLPGQDCGIITIALARDSIDAIQQIIEE